MWTRSFANELGQLTQGICNIHKTNRIKFIQKSAVPADHTIANGYIVMDCCSQKSYPHQTRFPTTYNNGAILTLSTIIKHLVSSAFEAELAALFYNHLE